MDDKNKTRPLDSSKISLKEDYEVEYWTKKFNVSAEELQEAVKKAGVSADAVMIYFKNQKK